MHCAECAAFISAYHMASLRYAAVVEELHNIELTGVNSEDLKIEAAQAWEAGEMAREALRVHREMHDLKGSE